MYLYGSQNLPITCTLNSEEISGRADVLLPGLAVAAEESRELPDGFAFRFKSDDETIRRILSAIQVERDCCRFLTFKITFEPACGPVWLEVSGPPGAKEFLASLFDPRA